MMTFDNLKGEIKMAKSSNTGQGSSQKKTGSKTSGSQKTQKGSGKNTSTGNKSKQKKGGAQPGSASGSKQTKSKSGADKIKEAVGEKIKNAAREATGIPKMSKDASLFEKFTAFCTFIFFKDKGKERLRDILDEETIREAKIGLFGLNSGDEKIYRKLKHLLTLRQKSILGKFERKLIESEKDYDRFRVYIADIHKDYLEEPNTDNREKLRNSPAYGILMDIIAKDKEGFDAQLLLVQSLAKKEFGAMLGYKDAHKNPLILGPVIFSVGSAVAFIAFLFWRFFMGG